MTNVLLPGFSTSLFGSRLGPVLAVLVALGWLTACGAASGSPGGAYTQSFGSWDEQTRVETALLDPQPGFSVGTEATGFADLDELGSNATPLNQREALAQVDDDATTSDSDRAPILIYTATLFLGVYHVEESQQRLLTLAEEHGGYLSRRDDTIVVIRIPAARFDEVLGLIEELGDVLHREIDVEDITEEYHDLTIRLETLHAMRGRLEELLERAETVADALQIQRELERITIEIESLEGRLRFLSDRVAFSTITVVFQSNVPNVQPQAQVVLPFYWLSQLGLSNLLYLW